MRHPTRQIANVHSKVPPLFSPLIQMVEHMYKRGGGSTFGKGPTSTS